MHLNDGVGTRTMNNSYYHLVQTVKQKGTQYFPRGLECLEIRPALFEINDPTNGLYTGHIRRLNMRFFAVECLSYIAGWGDDELHKDLMIAVNGQYVKYLDDETGLLQASVCYGLALRKSLPKIYEELKVDPYSRRCVASLWNEDTNLVTNEARCTVSLSFYTRDTIIGRDQRGSSLCMTAHMRSNDLNWGTPYDVASFCAIQSAMAMVLGRTPGEYTHVCDSLHVYKQSMPVVVPSASETFIDNLQVPYVKLPADQLDWEDFRKMCHEFLLDMYDFKQTGEYWRCFESEQESDADPLGRYFRMWGNLVRHQWPKK